MRTVIIETGDFWNVQKSAYYAKLCMLDSMSRGEAPVSALTLYATVVDDVKEVAESVMYYSFYRNAEISHDNDEMRVEALRAKFDLTVFYTDPGFSEEMMCVKRVCETKNLPYEERTLPNCKNLMRAYDDRVAIRDGNLVDMMCKVTSDKIWRDVCCDTVARAEEVRERLAREERFERESAESESKRRLEKERVDGMAACMVVESGKWV